MCRSLVRIGRSHGRRRACSRRSEDAGCGRPVSLAPLEAGDELVIETQPERASQFYFKSLRLGANANAFSALRHAKGTRNLGETVEGTYSIIRRRCQTSDRNLELTIGGVKSIFEVSTPTEAGAVIDASNE